MEYKNVRPMIKKLGIKGDPVKVSTKSTDTSVAEDFLPVDTVTATTQEQVSSRQLNDTQPVLNKEAFEKTIKEEYMFEDTQTKSANLDEIAQSIDHSDDSIKYSLGDVAKSFDYLDKKRATSKRVVGNTIPTEIQKVDSAKREEAENSLNNIMSSVRTLKSLTRFEKDEPQVNVIASNKQERYQPMNPDAERMMQFINGGAKDARNDKVFQTSTAPIASKEDKYTLLEQLEQERISRVENNNKAKYEGIRPLPFSEIDLRDFFSADEMQQPTQPLKPAPFKEIDLRKSNEDDQSDFFESKHIPASTSTYTYPNNQVAENKANTSTSPSYSSYSAPKDDFSLSELDMKDDDLYGEVVEQEVVEKEEKKNFISPDARKVSHFAWLAYILFFIPLLINSKSAYVRHSANEGLEINFVDVIGIVCVLLGKFLAPSNLIAEGLLIGLMIIGCMLLILTTVTKIFMICATLKGKYVSTPWFWNIEIIR